MISFLALLGGTLGGTLAGSQADSGFCFLAGGHASKSSFPLLIFLYGLVEVLPPK
jgi:hypothetical protein